MADVSVYVTIGNSDDRLIQAEWSAFRQDVDLLIRGLIEDGGGTIFGAWVSPSAEPFQNACWAFSAPTGPLVRAGLRQGLQQIAERYRQDSIAWTEGVPEFLPPGRS